MGNKKNNRGPKEFDKFFSDHFGTRWVPLQSALIQEEKKIGRWNHFFSETHDKSSLTTPENPFGIGPLRESSLQSTIFELNEAFDLKNFSSPILPLYKMDQASLWPAEALEVNPGDDVLDMCAAPGGKSLILAESLKGCGTLTLNELSARRRYRLMDVVKRYVSRDSRSLISITGKDGGKFGLQKKRFDKILIDAPCSGERQLMQNPRHLENWQPTRSRRFGIQQYALLASGFLCLRPGGRIVYSTCSLSPYENDDVIAKLQKRKNGEFRNIFSNQIPGEKTKFGYHLLPDQSLGGPIYFSIIEKL